MEFGFRKATVSGGLFELRRQGLGCEVYSDVDE